MSSHTFAFGRFYVSMDFLHSCHPRQKKKFRIFGKYEGILRLSCELNQIPNTICRACGVSVFAHLCLKNCFSKELAFQVPDHIVEPVNFLFCSLQPSNANVGYWLPQTSATTLCPVDIGIYEWLIGIYDWLMFI